MRRGGSIFTIFTAAEVFKCSSAKLVANLEQGWLLVGLTSVFLLTMSGIVLEM